MPAARPAAAPTVSREAVRRLWLERQGLHRPRGSEALTRRRFVALLEDTGGLQLDSVNVVERAHGLTLWSRFGAYDRERLRRWVERDRVAFEYWSHEASLLPASHLPLARRRMRRYPEAWRGRSWWSFWETSQGSRRRVLRRLRGEGPLEASAFAERPGESRPPGPGWADVVPREDKRTLTMLWHGGKVAVAGRRHFRRVYDLAERVYPESEVASPTAWQDSWLLQGLRGNGVATERHLVNYVTATGLKAPDRKRVIARNLRAGRVRRVRVEGSDDTWYALPEHLDRLDAVEAPRGTTLVCPFDSFLWQRGRAEELLDFTYRVEIYVPAEKRVHGYYVLPVLHDGRLVARLDPKLHREEGVLEVRSLHREPGCPDSRRFRAELREAVEDLAAFVGAEQVRWPAGKRGP